VIDHSRNYKYFFNMLICSLNCPVSGREGSLIDYCRGARSFLILTAVSDIIYI